jgi:transposase
MAKDKFDAHILRSDASCCSGQFENSSKGWKALVKWSSRESQGVPSRFILEPTGPYSQPLLSYLAGQGHFVSQVNPYTVKHYAISKGLCNKTDKVDARTLAHFGRERSPAAYVLPSQESQDLTELARYLESLKGDLQSLKNAVQKPGGLASIRSSQKMRIAQLQTEIGKIEKQLDDLSKSSPPLKEDLDLLCSINGIGRTTAFAVLAEMPDVASMKCAQSLAAYAGLNPKLIESGKSHGKTHISRRGNWRLRKAMFYAAMTAMRFNPFAIALALRLKERGMKPMAIVAAVMRKLLLIVYGVLKHRQPFKSDYKSVALNTCHQF